MTSGKLGPLATVLVALLGVVACNPAPQKKGKDAPPTAAAETPEPSPGAEQQETPAPPEDVGPDTVIDPGSPELSQQIETPKDGTAQTPDAKPAPGVLSPRCAIRLSIALAGKSPDATTLATKDVPTAVERLVASNDFAERFARFTNAQFNVGPAPSGAEDPVYYLAKHVITTNKPWSDLFLGPYAIRAQGASSMTVSNDPRGLGYFRSQAWMKRYAGNEPEGLMLVGAFRILSDTTGLELQPSVGAPDDDRTAAGRAKAPCNSCHLEKWYALDKVAQLLPRKRGTDMDVSFGPAAGGPQTLLGKQLADDKALLTALVDSDSWRFAQCRNVFKFLYGRPENKCEAAAFDRCVDALQQQKTIRAAVIAVATDGAVCQ